MRSRLDVDLVLRTVEEVPGGQLHLVGPDCLSERTRSRLTSHPRIALHGSVPAKEVPSWLVAFDVLICPHLVSEFTRSLDAIKAYEYLATAAGCPSDQRISRDDGTRPIRHRRWLP